MSGITRTMTSHARNGKGDRMTNEQAIYNIKQAKCIPHKHETLTYVIQALQADGDLISKNGLRNAVGFLRKYNVQAHDTTMDAVLYDDVLLCINELLSVAIPTEEQKTGHWKDFALWVAKEIFDEWEYNKDAFAEIACRKLNKLGIVKANGDKWELAEPYKGEQQ